MDQITPITHARELISRLGAAGMPPELCRLALPQSLGCGEISPFGFAFTWRDIPFRATLEPAGSVARLALEARLGQVPFSVESALRRRRVRRVIAAMSELPAAVGIERGNAIWLRAATEIDRPVVPATVIVAVTAMLLPVDGHLALLLDVLAADEVSLPAAA